MALEKENDEPRQWHWRIRRAVWVLPVLLVLLLPAQAWAALIVVAEPGTNPVHQAMVQKTVNHFNSILGQDMGVTLEKDVRIFLCPTQDSYRQTLQKELGQNPEAAARNAKVTGGFSSARSQAVVLNLDGIGSGAGLRTYKTAAHELFHQLQNQLAGADKSRGYYWLSEGSADLIGAVVAERVGYQSLEKWSLDQVNTLRKSPAYASPREMMNISLEQWTTLLEGQKHPYEVADLMVLYLLKQTGPSGYRSIGEYYRRLGQGMDNEQAFFQSFGLSSVQMVNGFQVWLKNLSALPASVSMVEFGPVSREQVEDGKLAVALTRQFLQEQWGHDLISSLRLIFTADKKSYAAAMVREFGVSPNDAAVNAQGSVWRYSGGSMIYDLGSLPTRAERVFSVADALLKKYFGDRVPTASGALERLPWLKRGLADATAVQVVQRSGARTAVSYQSAWLATLSRQAAYPALEQLQDGAAWEQAQRQYGTVAVNRVAGLAGLYLMEKYGLAAVNQWCDWAAKIGPEAAFQQVFRLSLAEFEAEFSHYLSTYAKKSA
ncbi:MAG TPA: hypothetical protein VN611_03370 [Patescibacteria group bacterium]|nr:hypothetical protein [Patescibacteria group bacterium]